MEEYDSIRYLTLLSQQYTTRQAAFTEIINLQAILNLPKGTEHFMSDIHGEYEAFRHILNNCSGVIREKVEILFGDIMSPSEQNELCTLIYYPRQKLEQLQNGNRFSPQRCYATLDQLIQLARFLSSKYTRSKVRKAIPQVFAYIIDELLHAQKDEDINRQAYHESIIQSIIETGSENDFICSLAGLIKRLAVDHLHIVGDIYDRGAHADKIMDILMDHHSIDIEWGNHDILWMGAASGNLACIAHVLYNNIKYNNLEILESGYGISLRELSKFADTYYTKDDGISPIMKAVAVLVFKAEGQLIHAHPEFDMNDHLYFEKVDRINGTVVIQGTSYKLNTIDFPTVDESDPCAFSQQEKSIMNHIRIAFLNSERLKKHMDFLFNQGSIYKCFNGNLLFHGCIPLTAEGDLDEITVKGKTVRGKAYMDAVDKLARQAYALREQYDVDVMWYLCSGVKSPLCGRSLKTFERIYLPKSSIWNEPRNPYYTYCTEKKNCLMILHEFGLYADNSHIINGHTPIEVSKGESPIKADGKLLVIDGGFCKAYQKKTGIAGYTLIYNSRCMRIKAHKPFENVESFLTDNTDISSDTDLFEKETKRIMIADTDTGTKIKATIKDLTQLLVAYKQGVIKESKKK